MKANPLFDINFLNELTLKRDRITYAKITALTIDELPVESIEGRVTGGSINVDGASAVRRTCSITMVAQDININDFYWGLKNKFILEIGLKNTINPKYPDIIWFKQGLFIVTAFNTSQSTNNYTINISGKDKMCLLNGEVGGTLSHSTDFGIEEIFDLETDTVIKNEIPIKTIIKEAVQTFGGEAPQNIIINDLDEMGLEIVEYRGETPLYLKRKTTDADIKNFINMTLDGEQECWVGNEKTTLNNEEKIIYDNLSALMEYTPTAVSSNSKGNFKYYIARLDYGSVAGYRTTDLVYPGDLISNIGEPLTSMLDKIKNVLGNFEYFYDINGKFVFQKKKNYVISPWGGNEDSGEIQIKSDINANNQIFNFTNGQLISSFGNTPNLLNLRNDFTVWGKYPTTSGEELPIHMRYAIDQKPEKYKPIRPLKQVIKKFVNNNLQSEEIKYFDAFDIEPYNHNTLTEVEEVGDKYFIGNDTHQTKIYTYYAAEEYSTKEGCDWRELIYQMALDYRKLYHTEDFLYNLQKANGNRCPGGKTGYEQYYIDLEGFWRELYNPNPEVSYVNITKEEALQIKDSDTLYLSAFKKCDKSKINLEEEQNYNEFYVICNATHISEDDTTSTYKSIYPFIEGFCHLDKTAVYFIKDEEGILRPISGEESLSTKDINKIYVKIDNNYISFVEYRFQNFVKDENLDFYIVDNQIKYNELDKNLLEFYQDCPDSLMRLKLNNFGENKDLTSVSTLSVTYYESYYDYYTSSDGNLAYWRKNTIENPESLIFWFDFLDPKGTELAKYSVATIGNRPKAINDEKVKSIYYREIPNTIFTSSPDEVKESGYAYIQIQPNMETLFNISSKGKSAKEVIDELLYNHLYCTESVNLSLVPVYHLEPNSRIYIQDNNSKVQGEYLINKITIPLAYNGMMTINGIKVAPESFT